MRTSNPKSHIFTSKIDQGRPGVLVFDIRKINPAKKKACLKVVFTSNRCRIHVIWEDWGETGVSVFGLRRPLDNDCTLCGQIFHAAELLCSATGSQKGCTWQRSKVSTAGEEVPIKGATREL